MASSLFCSNLMFTLPLCPLSSLSLPSPLPFHFPAPPSSLLIPFFLCQPTSPLSPLSAPLSFPLSPLPLPSSFANPPLPPSLSLLPSFVAQRRKLQASVTGPQSVSLAANGPSTFYTPNPSELSGVELQEETSGGEEGEAPPSWNWREDEK